MSEYAITVLWGRSSNGTPVASVRLSRRITREELRILQSLVAEGGFLEHWLDERGHRSVSKTDCDPPPYLESAI